MPVFVIQPDHDWEYTPEPIFIEAASVDVIRESIARECKIVLDLHFSLNRTPHHEYIYVNGSPVNLDELMDPTEALRYPFVKSIRDGFGAGSIIKRIEPLEEFLKVRVQPMEVYVGRRHLSDLEQKRKSNERRI